MEDKKINIVEQTKEKMFEIMRVPKECLSNSDRIFRELTYKKFDGMDDNIKRSTKPFMELPDGSEVPFGDYDEDGEFHINFDATSRYGYLTEAIYGVLIEKTVDGLLSRSYKIFVGECPHKDESGNWVTYNKVPSFYIRTFRGAYNMSDEPEIPHIVNLCSDEWRHEKEEYDDNERKRYRAHIWEQTQKLVYCSFSTYIRGLWNRIQRRFGRISHHKGKHSNLLTWSKGEKVLQFVNGWEDRSFYLIHENADWIWFFWIRKNGKWGFNREKRRNDHIGCEA